MAPGGVSAGSTATGIPENARAKGYEPGWECDGGYREANGACTAVRVPANGYFVASSDDLGWKCARGYRPVDETCIAVTMPKNAHLDYSGNNWEGNQPYRKRQDQCPPP